MVDFTYVAGNQKPKLFHRDPSFIYRCENPGRALRSAGHTVEWVHLKQLDLDVPRRVVVFHRPKASLRLATALKRLRRAGTVLIAEFDDLVFDAAYHRFSPAVLNRRSPRWLVHRQYRNHQQVLTWFDGISVATEPLAEHVGVLCPEMPVLVMPNCIHGDWLQFEVSAERGQQQPKVLSYFPGTRSHDRDFDQISGVLTRFLEERSDLRLQIIGPLRYHVAARPGQVSHQKRLPFAAYREQVKSSWLNLAPLEATPFTRCKSGIKVIEAASWGIPTLCSRIPDTERLVGYGAVVADEPHEWLTHLRRIFDDSHDILGRATLPSRVRQLANIDHECVRFEHFVESLG